MKPNYSNFKPTGRIVNSEKYYAYLCSSRWKRKRKEVIKRDKSICQCCLRHINVGYRATVHHMSYDRLTYELLSDLTTICSRCHREIHSLHPVPRYKLYDGKLMRIVVPSRGSVEVVKQWMRRGKMIRGGHVPRDADYYADRILFEVSVIEAAMKHNPRNRN